MSAEMKYAWYEDDGVYPNVLYLTIKELLERRPPS